MSVQERYPNFRHNGRLHLVRCFVCSPTYGRENLAAVVADGRCAWCGWTDTPAALTHPGGQEKA